jgi:SnoaL-like protein
MDEHEARAMILEHFEHRGRDELRASALYAEDAVLEFPQGGERIRGRENIIALRSAFPVTVTFENCRTRGSGDLWVNEYTVHYNGDQPHLVVGLMEFRDGKVAHERIYVTEPWEPPAWRAQWVEPMRDEPSAGPPG